MLIFLSFSTFLLLLRSYWLRKKYTSTTPPASTGELKSEPPSLPSKPDGEQFTIFIQGLAPRNLALVDGSLSVRDVLFAVCKRLRVSTASSGILSAPFNLYMAGRWLPLMGEETLEGLNMQNLSNLYIRYVLLGGTDTGDLTFSLDLSPDHCQYRRCKNRSPTGEAYKFKPGEEKFQIEACLAANGPATLRKVGTERLTLIMCQDCAAVAAQKQAASQRANSSSSALMLPPPVPVVPDTSSQLQVAVLQVLQSLGSSGRVAPIPDVSVIDRSVKNAKAKGAAPDSRLSVAISSGVRKMSQKTGYSKAHDRYELDKEKYRIFAIEGQGVMAKVFVQVKLENGTKKGESFHNIQRGVDFPPAAPRREVVTHVIENLLRLINDHPKLKGFQLTGDDFVLVDSSWTPILDGNNTESPTDIFFKGITRGAGKKGTQIGSLKFVQAPTPDTWFLVMKPGAAERYQFWQAGDEATPLSAPVKTRSPSGKRRVIKELSPEFEEDKMLQDFEFLASGPPSSTSSSKSTVDSAKSGSSKRPSHFNVAFTHSGKWTNAKAPSARDYTQRLPSIF
ncbi:hypothetical protein ARMSODRAFT_1026638 [Armillaria solidipes]|uniref:Uncharacterized protein n=1 Tax=Armillaria solidipes TaxID=1076256 RepID=A0A2H3ANE8_9AGAR|nr:hypothetical protein ARMSODRAFT_1026638 [Armillaria solidipes]